MFSQLLQLVEQNAGSVIINNPAIPDQHNNAAIQGIAQQIVTHLQSHASNGNIQQILSLFQNNGQVLSNHPVLAGLISSVANNLSTQYGVSPPNAQTMASSLLPNVMNQLISKTNNPNDQSFTLTSVMQTVSNNSSLNANNLLGQLSGRPSSSGAFGILSNLASKFFK